LAIQLTKENPNASISGFYVYVPYPGAELYQAALRDRFVEPATLEEWTVRLGEHGVRFAPVRGMSEVLTDPETVADEMVVELDHPKAGRIKVLGNPMKFFGTPVQFRRAPPLLGQHTREVLKEAGYTEAEVDQLSAGSAIRLYEEGASS
jgi:crotonobetainyl-CoA:carnitine CoA-transferase CaiB-like acyl-CoA transferase